ncbi:MAG: PKD domain-containing protein, partial [Anaerolineales bacterium]
MMERSTGKFEEIIRSALDGQKVYPSPGVLRTIRFRLWISDFFSVKPRKFNIAYASLLIAGLMAGFMLFPGKDETQESREKMSGSEFNNPQVQKDEIGETITAVPEQEEKSEMSKLKNAAPPVALFESNLIKGCAPLKVHFFNRSSGSEKFSWNFGTGEGSALTDPVYIVREPGNYEVSLQASNSQGTINKYTQTIQVFSAPAAEFSIDIDASDISGRKVVFDNLSSGGKKYIWDFGDSQQDTGFEQTHEYKNFGTYRVSLVAIAENGCSDTSVLENKFIEKNYELYFP